MANSKSSTATRGGLLLWLVGLAVLYQVCFQAFMWRALRQEEASEEQCVLGPDGLAQSAFCRELQLFRSWHQEEPMSPASVEASGAQEALRRLAITSSLDRVASASGGELGVGSTSPTIAAGGFGDLHVWGHKNSSEGHKALTHANGTAKEPEAPLSDRIAQAQKELCDVPFRQNYSFCIELRANLAAKARKHELEARLTSAANRTKALEALAPSVRSAQLKEELKAQTDALEKSLGSIAQKHSAWVHTFEQEAQRALEKLCAEPHHRNLSQCTGLPRAAGRREAASEQKAETSAVIPADSKAGTGLLDVSSEEWSSNFMQMVRDAEREMCAEPHRRDRADCRALLAAMPADDVRVADAERRAGEPREKSADVAEQMNKVSDDHATWERSFEAKVRQVHLDLCQEPGRRHRKDCKELLASTPADSETQISAPTPADSAAGTAQLDTSSDEWSANFMKMVRDAEREMCAEPHRRDRADCQALLATMPADDGRAAEQRAGELRETSAGLEAHMQKVSEDHAAWERGFEERVRQVHRELCQEPGRRHRKDCEEFLASSADVQGSDVVKVGDSQEVAAHTTTAFVAHSKSLRASIARESDAWKAASKQSAEQTASERDLWEKQLLASSGISSSPKEESSDSPSTALRQGRQQLRWSAWAGESAGGWLSAGLGSNTRAVLDPRTLKTARWASVVPKVACIAAVPPDADAKRRLQELIVEFHQQSYGGFSELVLVYHYQDQEAARLINLYADDARIKGVAAREDGKFPSATAMRFAAWSVKDEVQVVAHWDFETHHDRHRVNLQVRALAYTSRPACLLQGDSREETLAGDAAWMRRHWYPYLDKQHAASSVEDRHVAVVGAGAP